MLTAATTNTAINRREVGTALSTLCCEPFSRGIPGKRRVTLISEPPLPGATPVATSSVDEPKST
ncbi:hypothetical protein, partial [Intrasporangium mesophilum]